MSFPQVSYLESLAWRRKQEHALANVFNEPVKNLPGQVKEELPLFYLIGSQLRYDSLQKVFIHVSCVDV